MDQTANQLSENNDISEKNSEKEVVELQIYEVLIH